MHSTSLSLATQSLIDRGNKLRREQNLEQAISAFQQAIESSPDSHEAYHFMGETLAQQNKLDEAIASYKKAVEINPRFFWSFHCLGQAFYWQGRFDDAIAASKRAINLDPSKVSFYYQLGLSLVARGDRDNAIISFRKAIKLAPDHTAAVEELSKLEFAVTEDTTNPDTEESQSTLEGYLDEIDGCLLKGWVWDSARPDKSFNLIIFADEQELFRFNSNSYREDLHQAEIGTGYYGFAVRLPSEVCQNAPCKIKIQVEDEDFILKNSQIEFTYEADKNADFRGNCEPITKNGMLKGWAVDKKNIDKNVTISVYDGYHLLMKVPTTVHRRDLQKSLKGKGIYGYRLELPTAILDNQEHELHFCFENSPQELKNSPLTIESGYAFEQLSRNIKGNLDKVRNIAEDLIKIY